MIERATLEEMKKRYPKIGPMLNIVFRREGINALRLFWSLKNNRRLQFVDEDIVYAILTSGEWGGDRNRTIQVYSPLGYIFNESLFIERISRDIESIRLTSVHQLNVLMTGRKKIQEENAIRIIHDCYGNLNHEDLPEFLLSLFGDLEIVHGLPQITFRLESIGNTVATIILDGWSGQMIVNGVPQQIAYHDPKKFHEIVRKLAYDYVDKITAPAQ